MSPLAVVLVSLVPAALIVARISVLEVRRLRAARAARLAEAIEKHPASVAQREQLLEALAEARPAVARQRAEWAPPVQRRPDHDEDGAA